MRPSLLLLFLLPFYSEAQNPYTDCLDEIFKIDEKFISKRTDTTICYIQKNRTSEDTVCERLIICRDKGQGIFRIDKIFDDTIRYAYAYFKNGLFDLMQWNRPDIQSIFEAKAPLEFFRDPEIRKFYFAIMKIPNITMPLLDNIQH